ncbi:putative cytochrome P450 49a1, partial [Stegodyphus mimosarum]
MQRYNTLKKLFSKNWFSNIINKNCNARSTATDAADVGSHKNSLLETAKHFEEIPHLTMLPFIGTAWVFLPIVGRYKMDKLHLANRHKRQLLGGGDILRDKFGHLHMVFCFRPEDLEIVFRNEGPYPNRMEFSSMKTYRDSRKQWYKTNGIMILQGKERHDLRSKTQKHLLKPKAIQAYLGAMQDVARDFVQKIYETRDSNKEIPDLLGELYKWALESVAFVGLDTRLGCLETNLPPDSDGMKMINSVQTQFDCMNKLEAFSGNIQFWKYFPTLTWRKFTRECDIFTQIAFKYINRAMEELKKKEGNEDKELTLLQALLATKGLDVSGAMVTVADMLMAGIDTTSHSVGYLLYNLARFPDKQQILYEEISKLLPSKDLRITQDVFSELRYLKSCMKESQRMNPVVSGTVRQLENDVVLSGYKVPAGTLIAVILQEIYRDERYFKNPENFLPERWLEKEDKHHPYAFLPFGFGTRSCIVRGLAELETISLVTEIIRNFKLEYHHEEIDMLTRMINVPDKPLRVNFIER